MFIVFLFFGLTLFAQQELPIHTSDKLHFGRFWSQIREFEKREILLETILKRRKEIAAIKEHWRSKVGNFKISDAPFYEKIEKYLKLGKLSVSKEGFGGAYFLLDEQGNPCFVVKPIDEDILCLNNRKHYATPFNDLHFRVRLEIPLYRSAQAESLCYAVASEIELTHITPKTVMAIISSENFFDISDALEKREKEFFFQQAGFPDKEKLCSIQEYIPDMRDFSGLVHEWIEQNLSEEAIEKAIHQNDFEDAMILIWIIYDTDAHAGNIHVKLNSQNLEVYSLQKFDNGLTFPEKNKHFLNSLSCVPNALHALSHSSKRKIKNIPIPIIVDLMREYEMQDSIEAFLERMEILQTLSELDGMTIYEIDLRLRALELPFGKEIALSTISIDDLEAELFKNENK